MTGLVENWQELQPYRAKSMFLVRLLDLEVAFLKLPTDEAYAIFLMGFAQLSSREAAEVLGVHYSTVARRYQRGIESLVATMNGEPI